MMIEMQVVGLFLDASSGAPIVVLNDAQNNVALPIWIGMPEARAIGMAVNSVVSVRPMTHELYLSTIEKLGYQIKEVQITGVISDAYKASLILVHGSSRGVSKDTAQIIEMDARPSDAIALAAATKAKVLVAEDLLQQMGIKQSNIKIKERSDGIGSDLGKVLGEDTVNLSTQYDDEEFKSFLHDLKASDFKLPGDSSASPGE